jgi:hypothetical protein
MAIEGKRAVQEAEGHRERHRTIVVEGTSHIGNFMRIDLCAKCMLQKASTFRETIHCFTISPFRKTFCFACFAKNRDEKQTICFAK